MSECVVFPKSNFFEITESKMEMVLLSDNVQKENFELRSMKYSLPNINQKIYDSLEDMPNIITRKRVKNSNEA